MTLTLPNGGTNPGRAAQAQPVEASQAGAAFAALGGQVADVALQLRAEQDDRQLKRAQVDLTRDVNNLRLEIEQIGDPDAADAAWQQGVAALRNRYTQAGADGSAAPINRRNEDDFGLMFDSLTNSVGYDIGRRNLGLRNSQRDANWLSYMQAGVDAAARSNPETRAVIIDHGMDQIDSDLAAGAITPEQAEKRRLELVGEVDNTRAIRMIEDDPAAFLAGVQAGEFDGLPGRAIAEYEVQAQNAIERQQKAAQTEAEQAAKERQKEIDGKLKGIREIYGRGRGATDEAFLLTAEAQDSPEYASTMAARSLYYEGFDLETMTPAQVAELARAEADRDLSEPWQAERLELLEAKRDELEKGYDADPLGYAVERGVVRMEPLDFDADSDTLAATLQERAGIRAELMERGYGKTPRALTRAEQDVAKERLGRDADPDERARLASVMLATLGPSTLAGLNGDPELMQAAMLGASLPRDPSDTSQTPRIAREIMRGQSALLRDNVQLPPIAERRAASFARLDAVFADLPVGNATQERVLRSADAVYANRMGRIDPTGQEIDETIYDQALFEVLGGDGPVGDAENATGGIGHVNDVPTLLPVGISAGSAERALNALGRHMPSMAMGLGEQAYAPKKLEAELAAASNGQTPDLTFFTRDADLETDGGVQYSYGTHALAGKYPVAIGDDTYVFFGPPLPGNDFEPTILRDTNGQVFKFSLRALIRGAGQ